MTKLQRLMMQHRLCEESKPDGEQPGGVETPTSASVDVGEEPDPVVDEFLEETGKPPADTATSEAPKGDEQPAQPAAAPSGEPPKGEQPPAATPASTPAPAAQPAQPPAATPAAQPPAQPAQPPAQSPAQPAVQPPAAAQPPAQPAQPPVQTPAQPSAEEQQRLFAEQRAAYVQKLEQEFAIPPEDHDALLAAPHEVLPKLAARVQVSAVETVVALVRQNLPALVNAALQQRTAAQKVEEQFFSAWPKLNTEQGRAEATRLMELYAQQNQGKKVDLQQAINDVGLLVHAALRIPLDIPGAPPPAAAAAPASAPPPPAQPGAAGGAPQVRTPGFWEGVSEELFKDD